METSHQIRTTVSQTGVQKPAGAASSVFDTGAKVKPARKRLPMLDPATVKIRTDVPIPALTAYSHGGASPYKTLLDNMAPGASVVLSTGHAKSMVSAAKKLGIKVATRALGDGQQGVWRLKG